MVANNAWHEMSDFEQCSNQLKLDLIALFVNFSCELGQIITRYDFLKAVRVTFKAAEKIALWVMSAFNTVADKYTNQHNCNIVY